MCSYFSLRHGILECGQQWVTDDGIVFVIHIKLCNKVCIIPIQAQQMMATSAFTRSDLHFV